MQNMIPPGGSTVPWRASRKINRLTQTESLINHAFAISGSYGIQLRMGNALLKKDTSETSVSGFIKEKWSNLNNLRTVIKDFERGLGLFIKRFRSDMEKARRKLDSIRPFVDIPGLKQKKIAEAWYEEILFGCIAALAEEAKELYELDIKFNGKAIYIGSGTVGPKINTVFNAKNAKKIFKAILSMQDDIRRGALLNRSISIEDYFEKEPNKKEESDSTEA